MSRKLAGELIAETFGTFILVLLGVGVVVNVGLAPRMASAAGWNWLTICIGWCFAVVAAVYAVGGISGGHLNPAVTLAMAIRRGFPWHKVVPYWIAQLAGAFIGAVVLYWIFRDGLISTGLPNVWTGGPGSTFSRTWWGDPVARQAVGSYSILLVRPCCCGEFWQPLTPATWESDPIWVRCSSVSPSWLSVFPWEARAGS